jgi:pyruvate dehydrogenase E2 component (dihydrolipoamide acetyltransferase)
VSNPLVRKLARDNGVDVSVVDGSGPDRTVMRADVEAAIAAAAGMAARAADASPEAKDARTGLTVAGRTPLSRTRRTIAEAMEVSRREIPEASVWVDVDVTDLLRLRRDIRPDQDGRRPSLLSFMARLVCVGLARVPELNARLETRADGTPELVTFKGVNLGIAVDSERGLTVPAVQGADKLDARALDAAIAELAGRAREGRASVEELSRGTFTLNNYGVLGVDGSVAIINHPQVAILGLGRIIQRPWVVDGEVAVRDVTELSLTFDHRVCDGGTASRFLRFVADAMQRPGEALVAL